jgi:hypothetical protein
MRVAEEHDPVLVVLGLIFDDFDFIHGFADFYRGIRWQFTFAHLTALVLENYRHVGICIVHEFHFLFTTTLLDATRHKKRRRAKQRRSLLTCFTGAKETDLTNDNRD